MKLGQRIAYKQAKVILLTAFFIGGISAVVQFYIDLRGVRANFLDDLQRTVAVYQPNLEEAVYNLDKEQAFSIVNTLTQNPLFLKATIHDDFGDKMASLSRPSTIEQSWLGFLGHRLLGIPETYEHFIKVQPNTDSLARLTLTLDKLYMSQGLAQRASTLALLGLVSTLALSVVLFFVFYHALSRPIQKISHWVAQLDDPNSSTDLPYEKNDELGMLARNVATIWHKKDYANQQVMTLAYYDPLTELANRRRFFEQLDFTLEHAEKTRLLGAAMYLDIDRFKTINDSLGHAVGDQLLITIANRLSYILPQSSTVARFGGDEFVLLLPDLSEGADVAADRAMQLAEEIRKSVAEPIQIGRNLIHCSTSIGITVFPQCQDNSANVLRRADTALYRVKAEGRDGFQFYDESMQQHAKKRWELEEGLHEALNKGQFELWLQPQVTHNNIISGAEVLLRWRHPEKGMISPVEFIPIAEESGQISAIEEWVLEESLRQLSIWHQNGLPETFKHLAINISPAHFMLVDFVDRMLPILKKYTVPNVKIEFEITENLLIENFYQASSAMQTLQEHGVSFAIDDFGTGYSSLRYLNKLPLNILKIDRSFVQRMESSKEEEAIVDVILMTAKKLGLEVIAEGVETKSQLTLLKSRGCHLYQGFYHSKPLPENDFFNMLSACYGRFVEYDEA